MAEKILNEIKLELMDWKATERECENGIRTHKMVLALEECTRKLVKSEIKRLGGKTSEEEAAAEKKDKRLNSGRTITG